MAGAGEALIAALHARLTADPGVLATLGGPRFYDLPPRGASDPYVTIGSTTERDWSTGSEDGSEHIIELAIWSREPGRRTIQGIAQAIAAALTAGPPTLAGHRLISLRHLSTEIGRERGQQLLRGSMRLRAVTEPL